MIEQRAFPRYKVTLPVLCSAPGRHDFYAVTDDISAGGIRMRSSARVRAEEEVTCHIRHIGAIATRVLRAEPGGFVVQVLTKRPAADHFARELVLLSRSQTLAEEPIRTHKRIVPRITEVVVTLADGSTVAGRILNVSASGVGVSLAPLPDTGDLILIGNTPARVARQFEDGVGAVFVRPFDPAEIDESVVL